MGDYCLTLNSVSDSELAYGQRHHEELQSKQQVNVKVLSPLCTMKCYPLIHMSYSIQRLEALQREHDSVSRDVGDLRSRSENRRDSLAATEKVLLQAQSSKSHSAQKLVRLSYKVKSNIYLLFTIKFYRVLVCAQDSVWDGFNETFAKFDDGDSERSGFQALVGDCAKTLMLQKEAEKRGLQATFDYLKSLAPSTPDTASDGG